MRHHDTAPAVSNQENTGKIYCSFHGHISQMSLMLQHQLIRRWPTCIQFSAGLPTLQIMLLVVRQKMIRSGFTGRQFQSQTAKWSSTSATCGMTAGRYFFHSQTSWSRGQCSHSQMSRLCTRIHCHWTLHSYRSNDRCRGHKWWTSYCCGTKMHLQRYLSTQRPPACNSVPRWIRRTCCTRHSTSCHRDTAGQTLAYMGS